MEAERNEVQSITINILLKNPMILQDVWSALDTKKREQIQSYQKEQKQKPPAESEFLILRMFEDLLMSPMDNLPFYSYLFRQLSGKNRFRYARFVYRMMDN